MLYRLVGGGRGVEGTSEFLREKVKTMNEPLRSLLEYTDPEERETSQRSIFDAARDVLACIEIFEKSLYVQKHAYYFRKVREWHDYNEVR